MFLGSRGHGTHALLVSVASGGRWMTRVPCPRLCVGMGGRCPVRNITFTKGAKPTALRGHADPTPFRNSPFSSGAMQRRPRIWPRIRRISCFAKHLCSRSHWRFDSHLPNPENQAVFGDRVVTMAVFPEASHDPHCVSVHNSQPILRLRRFSSRISGRRWVPCPRLCVGMEARGLVSNSPFGPPA